MPKIPTNLAPLQEALDRHDEFAARVWGKIDQTIASGAIDVNEQLTGLYRSLDESAANVGRALHGVLEGRYSIKQCLQICSVSHRGPNSRNDLISPVIRAMVDTWKHRDQRFDSRQPCSEPLSGSTPAVGNSNSQVGTAPVVNDSQAPEIPITPTFYKG